MYPVKRTGVVQLVRVWPSELEAPDLILGHSNVCFDFLLFCVSLSVIQH